MVDNVGFTPGTGATIAADDVGGILYQRLKIDLGGDGLASPLVRGQQTAANSLPIVNASDDPQRPRLIVAVGTVLTRPANQTPYVANDSISDNATAGSVTAQPVTLGDINDDPVRIDRIRVVTNDTGLAAGKNIRVWAYASDPTASSGVGAGDNVTYSNKKAGFIGTFSGAFRAGHSDGGVAICVPDEGAAVITLPGAGAKTIWLQYQALDGFTSSANSTTLTPTVEGVQGRA